MKGSKRSSQPSDLSVPGVDLGQLERLLAFMSEHGLEEFEYAHGDLRIRLKKALAPAGGVATRALPAASQGAGSEPPAAAPPETSVAVPPAAATPGAAAPAPAPAPSEELHVIKSPIVGTFYSAPNPESEPFVKVGDVVGTGQTVCIIEAMKLMNEIEADVSGEVVRILVENGQPIEYGEHLFALRPTGKKK
jgi:acetyl-CoA carboxylase biotin carboxyl carrier protein